MNLRKKKTLAAKTLGVGRERIIFVKSRLDEIQKAITKQDIHDLYNTSAITIRQIKGRKKIIKKRKRSSAGNVRKKIKGRKREYLFLTRKLRRYLDEQRKKKKISPDEIEIIKKKIKNRELRNKTDLNEYGKAFG